MGDLDASAKGTKCSCKIIPDRVLKALVLILAIASAAYVIYGNMRLTRALDIWAYEVAAYVLFGLAILLIFRKSELPLLKPLYPLFFMPVWIIPLMRCWFPIPYIFCHGCPNQCAWGIYRFTFVPAYLGINLDSLFWCWCLCPLGHVQYSMEKKSIRQVPKALSYLRIPILLAVAWIIFSGFTLESEPNYSYSIGGILLAVIIILPARWYHRPFCTTLCPIGAVRDIILKIKK